MIYMYKLQFLSQILINKKQLMVRVVSETITQYDSMTLFWCWLTTMACKKRQWQTYFRHSDLLQYLQEKWYHDGCQQATKRDFKKRMAYCSYCVDQKFQNNIIDLKNKSLIT